MSNNLKKIGTNYKNLRSKAYKKQLKTVKLQDLILLQKMTQQQLDKETDQNNKKQLEFYQEKFKATRLAYLNGQKNQRTWKYLTKEVQVILEEQKYPGQVQGQGQGESYDIRKELSKDKTHPGALKLTQSKIVSQPNNYSSSALLSSFFTDQKQKIDEQASFKAILSSPQVSSRTFKKKMTANNNAQIQKLKNINFELKKKIQALSYDGQGIDQSQNQQIRRVQERLRILQLQNSYLADQNTKFKSQYGNSMGTSNYTVLSIQQMLQTQYIFSTRDNDLQKINARNSDYDDFNSDYPKGVQLDRMQFEDDKGDALSEIKESRNQMNDTFSLYQMSKSEFSMANNDSYHLGIQNDQTAKKNKKAFFKDSGVLVRDKTVDIAYKKIEDIMFNTNTVRLYIYLSNKIGQKQDVQITYDYQTSYFDFNVAKKVHELQPFKQERQILEIKLKQNKGDINSHSTAIIKINDKVYKIWIPVLFVQLKEYSKNHTNSQRKDNQITKTIYPSKIFKSPEEAQKIIPFLEIQKNRGRIWGVSKNVQGPIIFQWKNANQLEIKTDKIWFDVLSFIFLEYQ